MPRRPAPITSAEIDRALMRADQGKGTQLACLLKRCSRDDLIAAFSRCGADLGRALSYVSGRQSMRDEVVTWRRIARRRADCADAQDQ
ncbi:hypothetical protein [Inquilinus sp. OTU3971]|uniref:hypothetical protein n=1 Tax=Inquilinus sp. OTU3971 TaxID=3043855 RepID=UPI00313AD2B9